MGKIKGLLRFDLNRDKDNWLTTLMCIGVSSVVLLLMYNSFAPYTTPSKATFIITVVVFLANAFIICMKSLKKMEIHQIAFWTILILGVLSLLIQPVMNIPDEYSHTMRSELTSRFVLFPKNAETHLTIQAIEDLFVGGGKVYPVADDLLKSVMDYTKIQSARDTVPSNIFLSYIPQAVGMMVAKLFHGTPFVLMWLGRFANLLVYAWLTRLAIKTAPQFKIALLFVAALPMSIQQAASLSPDAIMNVSVFLLIAYFIYLLCDESFLIGKRELLLYTLISVFASLSKPTNVIFVALILVIPKSRFKDTQASFWLKCMVIAVPVVFASGWYIYTGTLTSGHVQYKIENGISESEQIKFIIGDPVKWASNFVGTMAGNLFVNLQMLSHFGWLDQNSPLLTMSTLFIFGGICARKINFKLGFMERIFIALLAFGSYAVINLALYLGWTPVGSSNIFGVQGRYLIPMLALIPLVFAPTNKCCNTGLSCKVVKEQITNKNMTILVSCISTMVCVMLLLITILKYGANAM